MSGIKKLAGQTLWYGVSSILAKFINYLLTPYLTFKFTQSDYGEMSVVYAAIPFLNVIFTYGMETAYFRFSNSENSKSDVFNTSSVSLIFSSILFTAVMILFRHDIASLLKLELHPEYITIVAFIIGVDALCAIPFARLRQDGRPRKYALIRVGGILINIAVLYFFISIAPKLYSENPAAIIRHVYKPGFEVGFVLIANLIQTIFTFLLLSKEFFAFRFQFNSGLWLKMMSYSYPLIIAGFAGMINETFDRIMLQWWAPVASEAAAKAEVGTYSACYKLSILITLAVQAFRMGAEPFFFKQASSGNAQLVYARVMKFFVITLSVMFLVVMLYLDIWKYFIQKKEMWEGLKVVPILLYANIFLGIYYNLSIWYKLGNKTIAGAYITIIGAAVTVIINRAFIPHYSYMACAWATFACYGSMMLISYFWGQKVYPVPYAVKKLIAYLVLVFLLFLLQTALVALNSSIYFSLLTGTVLLTVFLVIVLRAERKEFKALPVIGRYL